MKIKIKNMAITAALAAILLTIVIIFYVRSPVLIVTEESFLDLYSKKRVTREALIASALLFRQVKTVTVANDAGYDIVPVAVLDASSRPYCVIFPLRFARSAKLLNEQNPKITVIILEGMYQENERPVETAIGSNTSNFFIYKTDLNADFFDAGRASSVIDGGKNGNVIVFTDKNIVLARENFLRGLSSRGNLLETRFFTSFSQYAETSNLSCIVLAGSGTDIFDKKLGVPVILFSWINPLFLPMDTVLVIDDSPWVQARQAVLMAMEGKKSGYIKSKFHFLDKKKLNGRLLR